MTDDEALRDRDVQDVLLAFLFPSNVRIYQHAVMSFYRIIERLPREVPQTTSHDPA